MLPEPGLRHGRLSALPPTSVVHPDALIDLLGHRAKKVLGQLKVEERSLNNLSLSGPDR